jgi:IS30 family transposase
VVIALGLKQVKRRIKLIRLRCTGLTEAQIAEELGVSERTVRRDLKSAQAQEFVEELKRRQLLDIEETRDPVTRLKYRDMLLNKLIPKQVNNKIEGGKRPIVLDIWRPEDKQLASQYTVAHQLLKETSSHQV